MEAADEAYRAAIRAANADGASVRELAKLTGLAPRTVHGILRERSDEQ